AVAQEGDGGALLVIKHRHLGVDAEPALVHQELLHRQNDLVGLVDGGVQLGAERPQLLYGLPKVLIHRFPGTSGPTPVGWLGFATSIPTTFPHFPTGGWQLVISPHLIKSYG